MKGQRPACVLKQLLAQFEHQLNFAVVLFQGALMNPGAEPGRLGPIDSLPLPRQLRDPRHQEFFRGIARLQAELPGTELMLILPENLRRQDHDIRPAAVVEGVASRPILALLGAWAGTFQTVPAIRFDLRLGGHGDRLLSVNRDWSKWVPAEVSGNHEAYTGWTNGGSKQDAL